ncbi:MAG: phenylalanine--tRNA ligase subunit alpha [Planctomycetota bacterium]|nr:MAG: phenylalanine--tRNA ligase subunit alpha [Planctomycetota bacterium]
MDLAAQLQSLRDQGVAAVAAAGDSDELEVLRVEYLGRNGKLKALSKAFADEPGERKRTLGPILGETTEALRSAFADKMSALSRADEEESIDITLPRQQQQVRGSIHPITQVAAEVERVFCGMGFDVIDGPHIEEDQFNFSLLNIPDDHPARDAHDTFWMRHGRLLRTHTSAVQARVYAQEQPPLRKVVIGKVFRYDEVDATHDTTFTQVEGFLIDRDIHAGHLVATLKTTIRAVLQRDDVELRLRPSFFPFVEPGFEVDVRIPGSPGRFGQWVELLGCGMVHPEVLRAGNIDPSIYSGFAFGLGLERLTMLRHGIDDIRFLNAGDLRSLHQFAS